MTKFVINSIAHTSRACLCSQMPAFPTCALARTTRHACISLPWCLMSSPTKTFRTRFLDDERRAAVRATVARLRAEKEKVVRLHDLEKLTYEHVSERMGVTADRAHNLRTYAIRDLRRDRQLRRVLDEETLYYQHWGVNAFNTSWTSITEKVAM